MTYHQRDLHNPRQQTQEDIFARLRTYRQQLAIWNQEMADVEQRLIAFRKRQQILQTQIETWHRERDYLIEHLEMKEHKQHNWQQKKSPR